MRSICLLQYGEVFSIQVKYIGSIFNTSESQNEGICLFLIANGGLFRLKFNFDSPTLWGRTYLYSPYKGVPPPSPGQTESNFFSFFFVTKHVGGVQCDQTVSNILYLSLSKRTKSFTRCFIKCLSTLH